MKTKIIISVICMLLVVAHVLWPNIQIDFITLVILLVGILPWLGKVIHSLELPGGFKIELQDIKSATEKVTSGSFLTKKSRTVTSKRENNLDFLQDVAKTDPNLSLVGLRIEIEKRLMILATDLVLDAKRNSVRVLLHELVSNKRIDLATASGLSDLISLGNQAAHGVSVSPNAAAWALDKSPLILNVLDNLIANNTPKKKRK